MAAMPAITAPATRNRNAAAAIGGISRTTMRIAM